MMWICATVLIFGLGLLGGLIYFVRQEAKKSVRLAAIKKEAENIARAQQTLNSVRDMSIDSVREKLQHTK